MDLNQFKLAKEDDSHYHITAPSGKTFKYKKSGLNQRAHEVIKKLACGGMYDDGGEVTGDEVPAEVAPDALAETPSGDESPEGVPNALNPHAQTEEFSPLNVIGQAPASEMSNVPMGEGQASVPVTGGDVATTGGGEGDQDAALKSAMDAKPQTPYEKQKEGIEDEAEAIRKQHETEANEIENTRKVTEFMPSQQDIVANYAKSNQALFNRFQAGTIDPNRVFNNMSLGNKVVGGIALILGGMGAGLTGQANGAAQMLKDFVDRDVDAQKSDQNKNITAWKMNREAMGSDLAADLATKNQMYTALKYKIIQAGATSQSEVAMARAKQATAHIDQLQAVNNLKLGAVSNGTRTEDEATGQMNQLKVVDPKMAEDLQKRYLPGIGMAKVPISEAQRKTLTGVTDFKSSIDQAIKTAIDGPTMHGTKASAVANTLRDSLILRISALHGINRINEHELKMANEMVPAPGDVWSSKAIAQLQELKRLATEKESAEFKGMGIVPFKTQPLDQQAMAWAQANPNDPRAQQIMQKKGR